MSYPLHKVPGGSAARTVRTETGFWGLDLSSDLSEHSFSRAADTENLIWEGDALRIRPGYQVMARLSGRINGIFSYQGELIVHAGTRLYRIPTVGEAVDLGTELVDGPSQGVVRCQTVTRRYCLTPYSCQWTRETLTGDFLFLNDGVHYLFYDGEYVRTVADAYWGEDFYTLYKAEIYPEYFATVPFTAVAKKPDGGGGDVDPRGDNRLSQFRCESFYLASGETANAFRLNCLLSDFNTQMPPEVQLRDTEGVWRCWGSIDIKGTADRDSQLVQIKTPSLTGGTLFKYSDRNVIIRIGEGDCTFVDDGMDNIRITYAVLKEEPHALNGATVQGLYGADGADDVLFLGGSSTAPGEDAFSARNDFFCFHQTATELLGSNKTPVTGYCRLSDGRLAVLKDDPDGSTVFFRSHTLASVGLTQSGETYQVDVYPSKAGAAVEGCLSPFSVGVAGNEPCFLAESGLYGVRSVSDELTNLNETVRRSIPIDPLLSQLDPAVARSVCWKRYYLLAFGNTVFLTDGGRDSRGQLRFLKWSLAHSVTAFGKIDGQLYWGDHDGNLYLFGEDTDDAGVSITAFWQTPLLEEESGQRVILRRLWAAVSPGYEASVGVRLLKDRTPMREQFIALHRLNFADWDFGAVSFDGTASVRWITLANGPVTADALAARLDMSRAGDLRLWGFRMIYEKGGMVR